MKQVKVLHISETFVGGVYTYIKQVSKYSENKLLQTIVVYGGERAETNNEQNSVDFSVNTKLIQVNMTREISIFKDISSLVKLIIEIRRIKPDVIHLHSSKAGVLGRIANKFHGKAKLFYTPHGYSFIREDITKRKQNFYKTLEEKVTKFFGGTIIACGDQEHEEAQKFGKSVLIRNGVFIDEIIKFKKEQNNNTLTIGTSGRISAQKNPKLFNDIALRLPDFQFIWIGDGDLRNELNATNITITGWKKGSQAIEEVNKLDVFISTSLWEGLPFNIIEAMVLSKPILSLNIKANLPTINQNENGFICNNVEEFVSSIKKLEDKDTREKFGKESLKIANELFNLEKNFVDLLKLYTE
jgi:hypothetical protein